MPDKRAQTILFDTYWSSAGWRQSRSIAPEDFIYAREAGVMFDPVSLTHDQIVAKAMAAVRQVNRRHVADAFLASLTTRRLDLRSALGSFAVLHFFPQHAIVAREKQCSVCGVYESRGDLEDLNVLNFERLKWGGVRHAQPLYAAFDLELLAKSDVPRPCEADVHAFRDMLSTIRELPPGTTSANLEKHLSKHIKSNKPERDVLVGILGLCGILATKTHPGYVAGFVPYSRRELPGRRFIDMAYPACWWQASDGVNEGALAEFFGHVV